MTTARRPYGTDLSDARWALIEPMLSAWRAGRVGLGISPIKHDLREIVNAILYVNRTGIPWEYLPHDFPPYKTVHGYFALWEKEGLTEAIHDALRGKVRQAAGRDAEPTAAILDAQSVKTSGNVPEHSQGIDAGKKIKGRKRHIASDVLGLLLVILVTAASVHDTAGGRVVVEQVANQYPAVAVAWVDSGYKQSVIDAGAMHGIDVQVVTKDPQQRGFKPQRKRWAVERTFGWLMWHRRLVRDYETNPQRSRSMIHWAMIDTMSRRLTGESTPSWRDDDTINADTTPDL
ncbi:IS5-like element ISSco3 family transposase [Phytohabitans flavus]|uniref:DDE transposase n=1 Tax=Phytohabitans flavus TaxID=1076124 RepID=A0A6F8XW87_9ACTN|nr:IS5 family transposase [Phytohabitans flavus]BCB78001.1 DDE transposase [Phytohabitans flavus]